jgi:hypothetical protein
MPNNNPNKKTNKPTKIKQNIQNNIKHTKKHITHITNTHKDNTNEQKITTTKHINKHTKPNNVPPYTTCQTKNKKYITKKINKYTRPNNCIHNETSYKKKPKNHINTHSIKPYKKHAQHKQTKPHPKTYSMHPLPITCKHIHNRNTITPNTTNQTITPPIPRNSPQNYNNKPQHITPRNHLKQARPTGLAQIPKHKKRQESQHKTTYTKQTQHITIKHTNHITHLDHQLNKLWYITYKERSNHINIHTNSLHFLIILREDIETNLRPMSKPLPTYTTKITQHINHKNHLKRTRPTGLVQNQKNKVKQTNLHKTTPTKQTQKKPLNTKNK